MLRHRGVVLRVLARRSVATQSGNTLKGVADQDDPSASTTRALAGAAKQRERLASMGSSERNKDEASTAHHSPLQSNSTRDVCSKEGYNFVEYLRASVPDAALGRAQLMFSVYVLVGSVVVLYTIYYLTTYTYVLTTNPTPYHHSLFHRFPCDLAIVESRLTGRRRVVEATPSMLPLPRQGTAERGAVSTLNAACDATAGGNMLAPSSAPESPTTRFVRTTPAIVERRLRANALLYRVHLYLQKSHSLVLVNAQVELNPQRFMNRADSVGRERRAPLAFLREDQLLPDDTDVERAGRQQEQLKKKAEHGWWPWWAFKGRNATTPSPLLSTNVSSAPEEAPTQLYIESEVRLRDAMNGYQKGHLHTYEQTMRHLVQAKLTQRFYNYILERGMLECKSLRKVYAEEMIRNGLISGSGVTLPQLVPDVKQFADEVFNELKEKFGDDVIVYQYNVKLH